MRRTGKVVSFPVDNPSGNSLKVFAVVFYLFLAYMLTLGTGLSEEGLWTLLLLGVVYNFFVRQRLHKSSYFQENRVLLAILLVVFILAFRETVLLFLILGGLYWLLVGKNGREAPYFLKFHIVTALILNFFILMSALLVQAAVGLVAQSVNLFKLGDVLAPVMLSVQAALPLLFMGIFAGAAIWLSVSVLMGRTPYIGVVTPNVRSLS